MCADDAWQRVRSFVPVTSSEAPTYTRGDRHSADLSRRRGDSIVALLAIVLSGAPPGGPSRLRS